MISRNILKNVLKKIGVTRINSISKYDDLGIYVYQTCRPDSIHLTVDSGKGRTDEEAFIACAVEAIERFTAENINNRIEMIEINDQRLFIPNGKKISRGQASGKIGSYRGEEITSKTKVYIPTVYIDYKIPKGALSSHAFTGTTGLGAHSTMEMAICSGLVELIERDAIANGRYEKVKQETIHQSAPWLEEILGDRSARYGVLRYETEWPLEVVQIICDDPYVTGGMNAMGVGKDLASAIEDAALEAMQTWLMRLAASRDDWAYSRVMDKNLFDQFINSAIEIKREAKQEELNEFNKKYTNEIYGMLINHAKQKSKPIVAIKLESEIDIPEVKVVKVLMNDMKLLRQGPMMTGIPYMPAHP